MTGSRRRAAALFLVSLFFACGRGSSAAEMDVRAAGDAAVSGAVAAALAEILGPRRPGALRKFDPACGEAARRLYVEQPSSLLWSAAGRPTTQALAVIDRLRRADEHGLDPDDYGATRIDSLRRELEEGATIRGAAELEVALSVGAACYADHLFRGRVRPRKVGFDIEARPPLLDPAGLTALVEAASKSAAAADTLTAMAPRNAEYWLLIAALPRYRELAARLDEVPVEPLPKLRPGDVDAAVPALRSRLRDLGDLVTAPPAATGGADPVVGATVTVVDPATIYDESLAAAVRRFQERHGLTADGIVGVRTMAALQVPMRVRVEQIELALERWRWLSEPARRWILVNVPEYRVRVYDPAQADPLLAMNVVVGSAEDRLRTAMFAAEMQYLVFRPYWHVPRSIALREMIPATSNNPGYLERKRVDVVGDEPLSAAAIQSGKVRLRQKPGPSNSLGLIKFIFPNRYNIYMHDTPAKSLFARDRRDFSHGCIRVEDAVAFATLLLGDQGWDAARVVAATEGRDSQRVGLDVAVPVVIFYLTAMASPDGEMAFFQDVYEYDAALARALAASP